GVLSDLSFADLLLYAPLLATGPGPPVMVLGQVRPSTSQTLYNEDLVGEVFPSAERPLVGRALELGALVEGERRVSKRGERARVQCIPVRRSGSDRVLGVLTRESAPTVGRRAGELERVYVETFDRLARMIVAGTFPFAAEVGEPAEVARVSDGLLVLDSGARVEYASPNAVSALHRMGVYSNIVGMRLDELSVDEQAVSSAFALKVPVTEEVERGADVIVLVRSIPLLEEGGVTGAMVLVRDVTDLRRRDRLLMSKDATIREVHHRVKNNLQTISSLLRLQSRRIGSPVARVALEEADRRIRAIARVHEILSREASDQVPFAEIVVDLVRVAEDLARAVESPVRFIVEGDAGELPADVAMPLAVVLQELLQNAVEHAFAGHPEMVGPPTVRLSLKADGQRTQVVVHDNGGGLPPGFSVDQTTSLGLSIVRRLVVTQLGGTIAMRNNKGTLVEIDLPLELGEANEH
ncbi:MAG: sensor histidine kinase, partial [Acidimicrobiales bacterium]